jgi:O-antigen/teichoic acid export membrane protein
VGVYTVSYEIAGTPSTEIAMPVARALMPGLSKVGSDPGKFRSLYLSTLGLVLLVAIPAGIGVSALAAPITSVLLGAKWMHAVPLVQILALFGITRAVFAVSSPAYISFGRVDLLAKLSLASVILNCIGVSTGFYFGGTIGVAWGVLAASTCQTILTLIVQMRVRILDLIGLVGSCWKVLTAGIVMGVTINMLPLDVTFAGYPPLLGLLCEVAVGAMLFCVTVAALWRLPPNQRGPERVLIGYLGARFFARPVPN